VSRSAATDRTTQEERLREDQRAEEHGPVEPRAAVEDDGPVGAADLTPADDEAATAGTATDTDGAEDAEEPEEPEVPAEPEAEEAADDRAGTSTPPVSDNRRRAERTAPLFAELATLEKDDPRRERLREILVEEHLPLVRHFARRFSNRGEPFDDLLQVGTLGLIAAIDRFDPSRGVEFLSFAVPTITGEIKRHFRDQGWSVRVPRRLQELHLSLNSAVGELAQKNGRAPTPSELAEHLGIPRAEVLEGLAVANAYRSSSLDERLSGEDDSPTLAATLGEEDAALEGVEYRESLQPLLATIPARERRILILRFFGNMTQSQIAADIGISQMHVSRLLSQTLAKLREGLLKD
jgi:RNA polymerase sigma-B factor